jgi:hypothetical protein|tara:strand:+ start:255 stop:464 length:210 start_codon:yes stop_codon:yes gene_type:complete
MNELDFINELDTLLLNSYNLERSNLYSQTDIKEFLKSDINILKKKIGKQFNYAERQSEIENNLINQGRN